MKKEIEEAYKSKINGLEGQISDLKAKVANLQNSLNEKNSVIESLKVATDASKEQMKTTVWVSLARIN